MTKISRTQKSGNVLAQRLRFDKANAEAAKLILLQPQRYGGGLMQAWAEMILARRAGAPGR